MDPYQLDLDFEFDLEIQQAINVALADLGIEAGE